MFAFRWFRRPSRQLSLPSRASGSAARKVRCRPLLELLEDRTLPSTYTVIYTTDTDKGSGLNGDLRYCIQQANLNSGSTIQFSSQVLAAHTISLSSKLDTIAS